MNDNRWEDGTHKGLDRQKQLDANVDFGTNYSDAAKALWEKENAEIKARMDAEHNAMFSAPSTPVPAVPVSGRIIALLLLVAAFVCFYLLGNAHHDWKYSEEVASTYPTSAEISLPEETGANYYFDLVGNLSEQNQKYIRHSFKSESQNVYNYCENSNCTRPSTANLIKYVYPHIKPGYDNQQAFLIKVCKLDNVAEQAALPYGVSQEIKLQIKPIATGCYISNFEKIKNVLNSNQSYLLTSAQNSKQMFFILLVAMLILGSLGLYLLFRPTHKAK